MSLFQQAKPIQAIRLNEVMRRTGLSRATIWRRISTGTGFPTPFKLGAGRAIAWLERDIDAWLEAQAAQACSKNLA